MIGAPNPTLQAVSHLMALCNTCKRFHEIETPVAALVARLDDWHQKHLGHDIEFISRYRDVPADLNDRPFVEANHTPWYLEYAANADIKLAYAASAAYTCTLASLATSSTLLTGRGSLAVSNTTNLYLDYAIAGRVTVGTTPTINTQIEVWAYGSRDDVPTYPDTIDGTDAGFTITSASIKRVALALVAVLGVDATTSNRAYPFHPASLEWAFAGVIPKNHGLFVVHNTGVNLNSTGGNHVLSRTGIYRTA